MLIKRILALQGYHDEISSDAGHTGGGSSDLNMDIDKVSDQLSADLLGGEVSDLEKGSATPSPDKDADLAKGGSALTDKEKQEAAAKIGREAAEKAAKTTADKKQADELRLSLKEAHKDKDLTKLSDADVIKLAPIVEPKFKDMPKSMKAELKADYDKLPENVKAYVHEREEAFHRGIDGYRQASDYAHTMYESFRPYEAMLKAQGQENHLTVVKQLLNAHYQLSSSDEATRSAYMGKLMKSYGINLEAATKAFGDEKPVVDATVAKLQKDVEALQGGITEQREKELKALKDKTSSEVGAFAADPANPYFNEVADHIILLLRDPRISLKEAYEQAVWANPVTRAKEQARLKGETEAAARKSAEEEAAKAAAARGTVIHGKEKERGSAQGFSGSLDDALRESMAEIKAKTD